MLLGTKHTVKIIHTWAHVIIGPNFFFHHIRIVLKLIFFISILAKFSSHDLIFRSIIFLIVTPMPYQYHLLPFITNPFRLISQRCFSIFEQSLHFTNFRLIISVSIFFFIFIWVLVLNDCYSAISLITFRMKNKKNISEFMQIWSYNRAQAYILSGVCLLIF